MTEVFKSWSTEPMPQQPPHFNQPNYQAPPRYYVEQQYPQGQAWQQPNQLHQQSQHSYQQPYQQVQVAFNHSSPAQYPAHLAGYHNGSAMPSPAPSYHSPVPQHAMPSPAPSYHSPVPQHTMPNVPYGYGGPPQPQPQPAAVELPAELPGNTLLAGSAPVPARPTPTEVSSSSMALLARDLWSADSKPEEEKVSL
jgi:hypothetical protein